MTVAQIVVGCATAIAIAAVLGEVAWLRLARGRRTVGPLATVTAMALGSLPAAAAIGRIDSALSPLLSGWSPPPLRALWSEQPLLAWLVAFVAWDAAGYCYHRLGHATELGWASHQVHHSGAGYDMTLAWRQSWFPLHALVAFPPVALLGLAPSTLVTCAAVSKAWQALLHTSAEVPLPGWVTRTVMTPTTHRRHHLAPGAPSNLGPVLTVWDRLAGSWDPRPVAAPPVELATAGPQQPAWRIETEGWRELWRHSRTGRKRPALERPTDYGRPQFVDATQRPETR